MKLVRGAWKILVGIKDGLVLIFMLIFFGALFAALSAKPNKGAIRDGALVLKLDGAIVEQPATPTALAAAQGESPDREFRLRDLVRAIDTAKTDARVKVLVLDLDGYGGGYPATVTEVANAIGRFRTSGKKVLAYATAYTDGSYLLASNASEIWVNPMGGTLFSGPGGNQLYYKGLIDKLGVNVHVYRVGKFKSFVEPYTRADQSPEAKEAATALYGSIFGQWKELIHKARPKAQIDAFLTQPEQAVSAAQGDIAKANLAAGLVDKLGDRVAFGRHVAELAGDAPKKVAGSYATINYNNWVAANPIPTGGGKIGIVTVAGEIVDGKAGPGTAGGDTIAKAVLDALEKKELKALVVRVDSPGGSALASETIRLAVLEAKAQKLPIVISMGGLAASGGYWVSTAGDVIFAEPNTITGSIGIFGIIPTFENSLAKLGVTADGVKTTPLSGQPDVYGGTNPQVDTILQSAIEHGYAQFIGRVAAARKMTPQRVDEIGQGRVWDGGTARQIGLVDRFGTLDDAVAEAAKRAGLDPKTVSRVYLEKKPGWFAQLLQSWNKDDDDSADMRARDVFGVIAGERRDILARAVGDAKRLAGGGIGPGALPRMRRVQRRAREPRRPQPGADADQGDLAVIALRPARPDDAAAIAAIYAPYVVTGTVSFETEAPDARAMRGRMAASDGLYPWIVATNGEADGDGVLAYAYATKFRERPAYRYVVETSIYVAGAVQGQGVGRLLYRSLIDTLRAQGFVQAVSVLALPNDYSITLHETTGFRRAGVLREMGFKQGRWVDVGFWQCELTDATIPPAEPKKFSDIGLVQRS